MEGQEYVTVNPDLFCNEKLWTYRDLQKLCVKLNLGGRGKRGELVQKLSDWHRLRSDEDQISEDNFSMNVVGNNFALLEVSVKARKLKSKRRSSIIGFDSQNEASAAVSPSYLKPLQKNEMSTPGKSILKRRYTYGAEDGITDENCCPQSSITKMAKLTFSPFNGVKVIGHRHRLSYENI